MLDDMHDICFKVVGPIQVDHKHGVLHGAADTRRMAYAMGR